MARTSARRWAAAAARGLLAADLPAQLAAGPVELTARERQQVTALLAADVADLLAGSLRADEHDGTGQLAAVNEILALCNGEFATDVLVALGGSPVLKPAGEIPSAHDAFCAITAGGAKRVALAAARLIGDSQTGAAGDPDYLAATADALRARVRISRDGGALTIYIQDAAGEEVPFGWAWGRMTGPRAYAPPAPDRAAVEVSYGDKSRRDRSIEAQLSAEMPGTPIDFIGSTGMPARDRAGQLLGVPARKRTLVLDAWAKCIVGDLNLAFMVGHDPHADTRATLLDNIDQLVKGIALAGQLPQFYEIVAGYRLPGQLADDALGVLIVVLDNDGTVTPFRRRSS